MFFATKLFSNSARVAFFALCLVWMLSPTASAAQPDFTFIQISDLHFPDKGTEATLCELVNLGDVCLRPYRVTAPRPSFIIETGDLTEFGPKNGAWDAHNHFLEAFSLPYYSVLGNHDMTWRALSHEISHVQGRDYYSWNNFGCHFVVLRSAGIQDPRPILEPQQLEWLKRDLAKVGPDIPVFVALHHPLDGSDYSSRYEVDRLVDILRPYNIAAVLVGHSHSIRHTVYEGLDMIRGGSTWGPCFPGGVLYSVLGGKLRVVYKVRGEAEATIPLLEKPLHRTEKRVTPIEIVSPAENSSYDDRVSVSVRSLDKPKSPWCVAASVDGGKAIDLKPNAEDIFDGDIALTDLPVGVHYLRVTATLRDAPAFSRSVPFRIVRTGPKARWTVNMRAASKSTPALSDKIVYVGANDGYLRAYDRITGTLLWRYTTGGAITGEPLLLGDRVYFGSEDTYFHCINADSGSFVWKVPAESPVYSSAVSDGQSIYFGCCSGAFFSLDAQSGRLNWVNRDATYTVESKPFLSGGRVYYGAWDCYVYSVDAATGKLIWKCMGQGSAEGKAPTYYAPADCGPVVCGGKVFVADRKFRLSLIDVQAGKIDKFFEGVSAVALSSDGSHVYARKLDGNMVNLDQSGSPIWSVPCKMDDVPAAPREANGVVYVASGRGLVSAVSADAGNILWQYQATPQSYVLSSVAASSGMAFVSGTDGSLTAVGE